MIPLGADDTMLSKVERFWISFILRFAFGFLFLFASLNIFNYGAEAFSTELAKPFANTWVAKIPDSDVFLRYFLQGLPYLMGALAVPILTGIFVKPALRLGALMLVCLGLGKYIQNDIPTSASDFVLAFILCVGLYVLGQESAEKESLGDNIA